MTDSLSSKPDIKNSFANIRIFGRDMTNSENPLFAPPYNIRHTLLIKPLMELHHLNEDYIQIKTPQQTQ